MPEKEPNTGKTKDGWPPNVYSISLAQLDYLGVDPKTGQLYWDGKEVQTKTRLSLGRFERLIAAGAAAAAIGIFVLELGKVIGWWHVKPPV